MNEPQKIKDELQQMQNRLHEINEEIQTQANNIHYGEGAAPGIVVRRDFKNEFSGDKDAAAEFIGEMIGGIDLHWMGNNNA